MSEGAGSARGAKTKKSRPGACFVFAPSALCSFLEKDRGFPEKTQVVMFFTDDLAFSCTKPTNIYTFQESLGFFLKNSHKECRTKKTMPGHVLCELHRFLERNEKHAEQTNRKNTQNKKTRGAKTKTLTLTYSLECS